jgi:hypothetical protein
MQPNSLGSWDPVLEFDYFFWLFLICGGVVKWGMGLVLYIILLGLWVAVRNKLINLIVTECIIKCVCIYKGLSTDIYIPFVQYLEYSRRY